MNHYKKYIELFVVSVTWLIFLKLIFKTKLEIQKALAEDSTVYEYDSIYDEMQKKKEESNPRLLLSKDRKVGNLKYKLSLTLTCISSLILS